MLVFEKMSPRSSLDTLLHDVQITHEKSTRWDLPLNASKCGHLSVGNDLPDPLPLYPGGPAIPTINSTKDIGVLVDASFKPCGSGRRESLGEHSGSVLPVNRDPPVQYPIRLKLALNRQINTRLGRTWYLLNSPRAGHPKLRSNP